MEINERIYNSVAFIRVSSVKQGMVGDSPGDQKSQINLKAKELNAKVVEYFNLYESASKEEQPAQAAIDYCREHQGEIKYCFVKGIDRFTRGGAYVYGSLKAQLAKFGVQLLDVLGIINPQKVNTLSNLGFEYQWSVFNPSYKTELLTAEDAKDDVRNILTRLIGAEINYKKLGYSVRQAPPGFMNVKIDTSHGLRAVWHPEPKEASYFIKMFELLAQGNISDEEIVSEVNKLGYESRKRRLHDPEDKIKIIGYTGGKKLTVAQMQRYIQNPIYAGIICEKWTGGIPVKSPTGGLVSIETFNRANRGKIFIYEDGDNIKIIKRTLKPWQLTKDKNNPLYPYKKYVSCPICGRQFLGSGPRGKAGKHFPMYHCGRNHKQFSVPLKEFNETIESFVRGLKFSQKFVENFKKIVLEEWEHRERDASNTSITASEKANQIEREIQMLKDKIKMLTSPLTIQMFEGDIEKLEIERVGLIQNRDQKEDEQLNAQIVLNYIAYFMEHPDDLILGSDNHAKNASLFGLLFEERPTYDELVNGTPKLSCLFALFAHQEVSQKQLVRPA